jgi:multidrug efflux pump subunit AcrA (membrane-fusion protein)
MDVKVNVDNPGSKLKAGMFAKVKVITEQKDNIVKIPSQALLQRFGDNYVFVVEEIPAEVQAAEKKEEPKKKFQLPFGKKKEEAEPEAAQPSIQYAARKRIITPGILIDQILEIPEGLKAGEEVIVRGQTLLDDGARINVVDRVKALDVSH